jgi:hypothetical protein
MQVLDLKSGDEFSPADGYEPMEEAEVEFYKRVLPGEFCLEAFKNAVVWFDATLDAAEDGTLHLESLVREYSAQSGLGVTLGLDSPVASARAAVPSSTPATQPKPSRPPAQLPQPEFLKNKDLFGLEPALSIRTRILLACHAQTRMNMSLDIAKSFAIAGYFPRQRYACLPSAFFIMHLLYLQTSEAESISGRSGSSKWRAAARRKARFWSKT